MSLDELSFKCFGSKLAKNLHAMSMANIIDFFGIKSYILNLRRCKIVKFIII